MSKESLSSIYPEKVDLNNCDKEPIHLIGKIQNHGVLIAGNLASKKITRCSENCDYLFNKKPKQLFDQPISDLLSATIVNQLLDNIDSNSTNYLPTQINQIEVDIIAHLSGEEFIFEFEWPETKVNNFVQQSMLTTTVSKINSIKDFNELNDYMTTVIKNQFGLNRVMIYQFDQQWNGNVVAEAKEAHLQSWLGLHYPSTDIPVPARRLFYNEQTRMIRDVSADTIAIIAKAELVDNNFDLSKSELRATSPIHIEYLKNMKVGATMTMPIVSGNKVWGLVACHHSSAKALNFNQRLNFKFLTKFFANQIHINKSDELLKIITASSHMRGELINQVIDDWSIPKGLSVHKYTLNDLTESEGAAICLGNKITVIGQCPSEEQILSITNKIRKITNGDFYETNSFMADFEEAKAFQKVAAGIMCVFISEERKDSLLLFKPEVNESIYWAGKPQDKSAKDSDVRLSPRKSFESWQDKQEGIAAPWKSNEIAVIKEFQKNIMHFVTQKYDEIKLLNNKLKAAYKELETFSYSVSHDLRAPLRGIDGFTQILKEDYYDALDDFGKSSIETIISSVQKMNMLIDDILSYSSLDQKKIQYQKITMQQVFEQEINLLSKDYPKSQITIETLLPDVYGDPSIILLLVRNLLDNALKYSSKETHPKVNIGVLDNHTFYVQDNGVGFDEQHNENIFKVFNRLTNDNFKGSGIGLSIAKRVVDKHKGKIWAKSEKGKGATFYFNLNQKDE